MQTYAARAITRRLNGSAFKIVIPRAIPYVHIKSNNPKRPRGPVYHAPNQILHTLT